MIEKIEIVGIQLDNCTVREAMMQVEQYLGSTGMNTIEAISMEMLVQAKGDEALREGIQSLDLAVVSEKEILRTAGVNSAQRIRETVEHQFFSEFVLRILKSEKTVYLLGELRSQVEMLESFLRDKYERIRIVGSYAMEECVGDYDGVVNEINIASPDIIFSILPTPDQEYFLMENKSKMNAAIWYGLEDNYGGMGGMAGIWHQLRRLVQRGVLRSMQSKYNQKKEDDR